MGKKTLSAQQKHDNTFYKQVENEKENLTVFLSGLNFKTRTAVYKLTAYKLVSANCLLTLLHKRKPSFLLSTNNYSFI